MSAHPKKVSGQSWRPVEAIDGFCFVVGTALVLWLAWLLLSRELALAWWSVLSLVGFWLLTAYVGLPRLQEVLAKVFVPDYFIGRTVTASGILGDPVNLALDGTARQVHAAMARAGWTRAEEVTLRSSWGIIVSALLRRSDRAAPVSPLFLFGAREEFAYEQQVGQDASRRHHVRFWPTPEGWLLPGARHVDWLAAGTFDRAVGLSLFTLQVTHKIDADIDLERDHVVATVTTCEPRARVEVLSNFVAAFHARNGGGDIVRTDGNLVVLDLTAVEAPPAPDATATVPLRSRRLPPPPLLVAGALSAAKAIVDIVALHPIAIGSTLVVVLWLLTYARRAAARSALMLGSAALAVLQLIAVDRTSGHLPLWTLLEAGISVLVVIVASSDRARRWVQHR